MQPIQLLVDAEIFGAWNIISCFPQTIAFYQVFIYMMLNII